MSLLHRHGVIAGAGGGGSAVSAAQINEYRGFTSDITGTGITYTGAPLGAGFTGRIIYAIHGYFDVGTFGGPETCSVTIGGNAATLLGSIHDSTNTTAAIGIWAYQDDGALGTSADIVVTDANIRNSLSIGVVIGEGDGITVLDTASDGGGVSSGVSSSSLDTTGAECLLYVCHMQNGADVPPDAPFTDGEDSFDENSNEWVIMGWDNSPSGSIETVDLPTGHSSLRGCYIALALANS